MSIIRDEMMWVLTQAVQCRKNHSSLLLIIVESSDIAELLDEGVEVGPAM